VIKANPEVWAYFDAREYDEADRVSDHLFEGGWTLGTTYRNELMSEGDLVVLVATGSGTPGSTSSDG
jgi:hypothetical protein